MLCTISALGFLLGFPGFCLHFRVVFLLIPRTYTKRIEENKLCVIVVLIAVKALGAYIGGVYETPSLNLILRTFTTAIEDFTLP